jgi:tetraacyldisaccharide 4'-kinase
LKSALQRGWRTRNFLSCVLWPVSVVYGMLITFRRWLYRAGVFTTKQVGVPIVVVGNVTVGGGGKTPLVMALAAHFARQGVSPGVISRGYGRKRDDCLEVLPTTPVTESGDEPALIKRARAAPVFVARNRIEAAQALLAAYPDTRLIISDDGLQHDRLHRTVNVVVFDDSGLGNGWLLPAGPLRQRWPLMQQSVPTLVLHTGRQPAFGGFRSQRSLAHDAVSADGQVVPLASLMTAPTSDTKLVALAGIAHPEAFFAMLTALGLPIARTLALADHADFSNFDLSSLALPDCSHTTVLCTEKDAIKLFGLPQIPSVRLLAVPLVFTPEPAFFTALDQVLALAHNAGTTHQSA